MKKNDDRGEAGIVTTTPTGSIVSADDIAAMQWFDPSPPSEKEERMIPYIRLMQGLSAEVQDRSADIGDLLVSTGMNLGKTAKIVPLWLQRQAIRYDRDNDTIDCRSLDGDMGDKYGECKRCPHYYRNWVLQENGTRTPPSCTAVVAFPAIVLSCENDQVTGTSIAAFQFARSSFTVAKQIITQHDLKELPYYAYAWEIGSRRKKFKKGEAAVFTARFLGQNSVELMKEAQSACKAWTGAKVEIAEDHENEKIDADELTF